MCSLFYENSSGHCQKSSQAPQSLARVPGLSTPTLTVGFPMPSLSLPLWTKGCQTLNTLCSWNSQLLLPSLHKTALAPTYLWQLDFRQMGGARKGAARQEGYSSLLSFMFQSVPSKEPKRWKQISLEGRQPECGFHQRAWPPSIAFTPLWGSIEKGCMLKWVRACRPEIGHSDIRLSWAGSNWEKADTGKLSTLPFSTRRGRTILNQPGTTLDCYQPSAGNGEICITSLSK